MKVKRKSDTFLPDPAWVEDQLFLAVDPGIGGTGAALFTPGCKVPQTWVFNAKRTLPWWQRALSIAGDIDRLQREYRFSTCFCECPQFFASASGEMVAGRGDLVKLSIAVGAVAGVLRQSAKFYPIEVNVWKGQLTKENVNRRIARTLGAVNVGDFVSHAWDAVGIGLFAKGKFE